MAACRKFKRIFTALDDLRDYRIIDIMQYIDIKKETNDQYAAERKGLGIEGKGRKKSAIEYTICKKKSCNKKPTEGQAYCSREHAPLGYYGIKKNYKE